MGLEDRQYYRDEDASYANFGFSRYSMVTTLIIINVAIFVLDAFSPRMDASGTHWLCYLLGLKSDHLWQVWNFLTYGFVHSSYETALSYWHIGGNMLGLFFLGHRVEHKLGRWEFMRFYLISIVVCGLGFTLIQMLFGADFGFLVGASGGVSAVIALFIFMFPNDRIYLMAILPIPAWLLGVLFLFQNISTAMTEGSQTAWEAHLIGFAFGVAYFYGRWDFGTLRFGTIPNPLKSRPNLRVHDPDSDSDPLQEKADLILKKISEFGEPSLTAKERRILKKYSEQLRKNRPS